MRKNKRGKRGENKEKNNTKKRMRKKNLRYRKEGRLVI
jgi:hypothetical protein